MITLEGTDHTDAHYTDEHGHMLTEVEELALGLPPASEAWNEREQDVIDQQADYEASV